MDEHRCLPWFYRAFAFLYVVLLAILILPVVVRGLDEPGRC